MRVPKPSAGLLCAGLALAALPAAAEDLTIVFKTDKGARQTQYYTSSKARHNMGDRDTIMDFATGTITTIDNKKKEYSQFTLDQMEAAMKQAAAQMEQAMAKVPPEMRAQMEKMMGGGHGRHHRHQGRHARRSPATTPSSTRSPWART